MIATIIIIIIIIIVIAAANWGTGRGWPRTRKSDAHQTHEQESIWSYNILYIRL